MLTSLWTALPQAEKAKYVREAEQNLQKSGNRGEVLGEVNLGQGRSAGAPEISPDLPTGPSTSSLSNVPTSQAEEADRSNMKEESQAYRIFYSELRQGKDNGYKIPRIIFNICSGGREKGASRSHCRANRKYLQGVNKYPSTIESS